MSIGLNQEELRPWFREVKRIPVMTKERENEIKKMMLDPNITSSQVAKLKDEMVTSNLRFVLNVAKKYVNQGLDDADIISEGNTGLIRAFDSFDWSSDTGFNTYSVHWIRQRIIEALHIHGRTIRIPVNVIQDTLKEMKSNTDPDANFRRLELTQSYNNTINEDGDTLIEMLYDKDQDSIDDFEDSEKQLTTLLMGLVNKLEDREKEIILMYHGFKGAKMTLEEIGDEYGLTKERVRQIKEKTLRKLRMDSRMLFDYLEN